MLEGDQMHGSHNQGKATSIDGGGTQASTLLRKAHDPDVLYLGHKDVDLSDKYLDGVYYIDRTKFMFSKMVILQGNEGPVVLIPFTKEPGVPHP